MSNIVLSSQAAHKQPIARNKTVCRLTLSMSLLADYTASGQKQIHDSPWPWWVFLRVQFIIALLCPPPTESHKENRQGLAGRAGCERDDWPGPEGRAAQAWSGRGANCGWVLTVAGSFEVKDFGAICASAFRYMTALHTHRGMRCVGATHSSQVMEFTSGFDMLANSMRCWPHSGGDYSGMCRSVSLT